LFHNTTRPVFSRSSRRTLLKLLRSGALAAARSLASRDRALAAAGTGSRPLLDDGRGLPTLIAGFVRRPFLF
jgi:hypothetical protein